MKTPTLSLNAQTLMQHARNWRVACDDPRSDAADLELCRFAAFMWARQIITQAAQA